MINRKAFSDLVHDAKELQALVAEMTEHHGKEYCVVPSTILLHALVMLATEVGFIERDGVPSKSFETAAKFIGVALRDALWEVGFTKEEVLEEGKKILE